MVWNNFKKDLKRIVRKEHKQGDHKAITKAKNLQSDIQTLLHAEDLDESAQTREEIVFLSSELAHLNMVTMRDYQHLTHTNCMPWRKTWRDMVCHTQRKKATGRHPMTENPQLTPTTI